MFLRDDFFKKIRCRLWELVERIAEDEVSKGKHQMRRNAESEFAD